MKKIPLILLLFVAFSPPHLLAQESGGIPEELAASVLEWFNDPSVLRFDGSAAIPAGQTLRGPTALVRGELRVDGRIDGDVVLLDADLRLGPEAEISGDVLIVGGRVRSGEPRAIAGELIQYATTFRWAYEGTSLVLDPLTLRENRGIRLFGSRITVRGGNSYNRIEGLPVLFGPVVETSGPNPFYVEGLATFRTETGFTSDEKGFRIRLEQRFARPTRVALGLTAYSEVTPIESWGIGDLEASMATFLLHRDYRDHYERHGWSAYISGNLRHFPLSLRLAYRDEKHFDLNAGSPWTLKENELPWRPLPLVGEGDARLVDFEFQIDDRNDASGPSDGWFLDGRLTYGLTGDLVLPSFALDAELNNSNSQQDVSSTFSAGFLDLRRYARVDPTSTLAFRTVLAGTLNGRALPPQFQHVLGGEGTLPGYGPLSLDCGARESRVFIPGPDAETVPRFTRYGCDRVALFQAEYRNERSFSFDLGREGGWLPNIELESNWILFFNVGRGWSDTTGGIDFDDKADLGAGIEIGGVGAYMAYPINGNDRFNFFVRLQRRF